MGVSIVTRINKYKTEKDRIPEFGGGCAKSEAKAFNFGLRSTSPLNSACDAAIGKGSMSGQFSQSHRRT